MSKIYNMVIVELMKQVLFLISQQERLDSVTFDQMEYKEKIKTLKMIFENAMIGLHDTYTSLVAMTEENPQMFQTNGVMDEDVRKDYEMQKRILAITSAVKGAVDTEQKLETGRNVLFKCFAHDDSTPSMTYSAKTHGFHCFGCQNAGEIYDVFSIIGLIYEVQEGKKMPFSKQVEYIAHLFVDESYGPIKNIFYTEHSNNFHQNYIPYSKEMNVVRHNKYLNLVGIKDDKLGTEYLESRGISQQTAHRQGVMTCYPKSETGMSWGRAYMVFINSDGSYVRRLFKEDKEKSANCPFRAEKWWNRKGCTVGIFNGQVIPHCEQFGEVCFVCESATDALSCEEVGFHAIALNGVDNAPKFLEGVDPIRGLVKYICLSDNDTAGHKMADQFSQKGVFVAPHLQGKSDYALSQYKDSNECIVADKEGLFQSLCEIEDRAKKFYQI